MSRLIRPCEPRWIIWRSSWKIQCVVSATLSQGWRKINYLKLMIFKLISSAFFSVQVFVIICLNFNFCFFFLFVLKNVDARKILNMALQLFFYQILVELPGIDQVTHIYYRVYPRLVIHHDFPRGIKKKSHIILVLFTRYPWVPLKKIQQIWFSYLNAYTEHINKRRAL